MSFFRNSPVCFWGEKSAGMQSEEVTISFKTVKIICRYFLVKYIDSS